MQIHAAKNKACEKRHLVESYLTAREAVVDEGYASEIDWQESRCLHSVSESQFLEEYTWVVLSSGMRESVIRRLFPDITKAFLNWKSASSISLAAKRCENAALSTFNNRRKIGAIIDTCNYIAYLGFEAFHNHIAKEGVDFISTLSFMGPATSYHLAKNIGMDVVKPDRHLIRIAQSAQYPTPAALCDMIATYTGDKVSVIDVILWRYATIDTQYTALFNR